MKNTALLIGLAALALGSSVAAQEKPPLPKEAVELIEKAKAGMQRLNNFLALITRMEWVSLRTRRKPSSGTARQPSRATRLLRTTLAGCTETAEASAVVRSFPDPRTKPAKPRGHSIGHLPSDPQGYGLALSGSDAITPNNGTDMNRATSGKGCPSETLRVPEGGVVEAAGIEPASQNASS